MTGTKGGRSCSETIVISIADLDLPYLEIIFPEEIKVKTVN